MKKRILLSLMSFFMMTAMWANLVGAYAIKVTADANGKVGQNATLTLNLKNRNAIANWTCKVVLPEGVTFVEGSEALVTARIPEGAETEFTATANEDGTVTFTFGTNVALTGTEGAVATFEVAVGKTATPGEAKVLVTGAILYELDNTEHPNTQDEEFPWTIEEADALVGDVNADGEVTIADFVAVLNAMAGSEVPGDADVNGDGEVTIADGVAVLNIMAGGN